MKEKKFNVSIIEKEGTCDSILFEKMVKNGDVVSTNVGELINRRITVTGYAHVHIDLGDSEKEPFDVYYFNTNEVGLINTGSEIFCESVMDYKECGELIISEIKLKKGQKTYKVMPDFNKLYNTYEETKEGEEIKEGGEIND